jgi:hypothetical protein
MAANRVKLLAGVTVNAGEVILVVLVAGTPVVIIVSWGAVQQVAITQARCPTFVEGRAG